MLPHDDTDSQWYSDYVLAVAAPGGGRLGPVLSRQAEWDFVRTRLLRETWPPARTRAIRLAARQGFVLTKRQAIMCGLSAADLRRLIRRGEWTDPRRGVVCVLAEPAAADLRRPGIHVKPHGASLQVCSAAAALARPATIVSHESAAAAHGLPLRHDHHPPRLTSMAHESIQRSDLVLRGIGYHPADVTEWYGVPVTTVARTIVDLSRGSVAAGLIAADAALHDHIVSITELRAARARESRRPGITGADRVIDLADGDSESPLESLVRLCLINGGLPRPKLQRTIHTHRGSYRVDMLYPDRFAVIEADGELKYRDTQPGSDENPLVREKRRQEALSQAGYEIVRVSWWEVTHEPVEVVARVRRALTANGRRT